MSIIITLNNLRKRGHLYIHQLEKKHRISRGLLQLEQTLIQFETNITQAKDGKDQSVAQLFRKDILTLAIQQRE